MIGDEANKALRLLDKKPRQKSRANGVHESHGEAEAEQFAEEALARLNLPNDRGDLDTLRRSDHGKVLLAALSRWNTTVGNSWIAERLRMGHHGSVSRLVITASQDEKHVRELRKLIKM